jgi:PAS domain-containing protein
VKHKIKAPAAVLTLQHCYASAVQTVATLPQDKVPESILIADTLHGKIRHVNVHFRNRIMDFGDINNLFFVQDLVRERDRAAVRDCMAAAVAAAAGGTGAAAAAVQDVDCDILVLSSSNQFPLYTGCHVQLSVDGADIVMSVRPRHVPTEGCACNAAAPVTTSTGDSPASANNVDDVQDYVNNAPIALQFLSSSGHVLWTNKVTLDLLGYEASEFIGKQWTIAYLLCMIMSIVLLVTIVSSTLQLMLSAFSSADCLL